MEVKEINNLSTQHTIRDIAPVSYTHLDVYKRQLHDASDVNKAQKADIELVKASRHAAKDLHSLEKVFHQVTRPVAVPIQRTLLFAVDPGGDDDLHAFGLGLSLIHI